MNRICIFLSLVLILSLSVPSLSQRVSGKLAGRGRGNKIWHTGSHHPSIQQRTQTAVNYYDNKDGAKIVKASHFEFDYMLGRKITFFCEATGIPIPEVNWFKDGAELYQHRFFQVHEWTEGNDTIKSKMEIDPTTQKDAGYYECQANNIYAIDRRGFRTDYVMVNY